MNTLMLDTPIWQLTPRQLFELQEEWQKNLMPKQQELAPEVEWVTVEKASELLNRSKVTIYRWVNEGKMLSKNIGSMMLVNIKRETKKEYKPTKRKFI